MPNSQDLLAIVKTYLEDTDNGRVDAALELLTDDFFFKYENGSEAKEGDKQEWKLFQIELAKSYTSFKTTIKNATQRDNIVRITATTKFKTLPDGPDSEEHESEFVGEWEFVEEKIHSVKAKTV